MVEFISRNLRSPNRQSRPQGCYAELISVYHTSAEIAWMRNVLDYNGQVLPSPPTVLYTNSEGAIAHTKDHKATSRNKHWAPKYHYVRELKKNGIITYKHIPGSQNPADFLTKSVSRSKLLSSITHSNRVKNVS